MTPRKRHSFFIDDELGEGLKVLKARDGTAEAEAVRRAIAEYLKARGVTVRKSDRKRAGARRRS